jgi:hypothetical protein
MHAAASRDTWYAGSQDANGNAHLHLLHTLLRGMQTLDTSAVLQQLLLLTHD